MATKIIKSDRVAEVIELLVEGRTRNEVRIHLQQKYGTSRRSHDYDIEEAFKQIREQYEKDNGSTISKHFAIYDKIISQAIEDKMYETALKSMVQKEKLLKLHNPDTQVNVQNNTLKADLSHLTVDQIKELLDDNNTR